MRQSGAYAHCGNVRNELGQITSVRRTTTATATAAVAASTAGQNQLAPRINNKRNFTTCNELQIFSWQNMWSIYHPQKHTHATRYQLRSTALHPLTISPPSPIFDICEFGLFATPSPFSTYGLCARLYLLYSWSCYKCDINVPRRAAFSHRMSFLIKLSALVQFAGLSSLCPMPRPLRPLLVTYAQQSTPMPLLGVLRVCEGATASSNANL